MLKYASAQIMTTTLVPTGLGRRELRRFAHKHHFSYEVRPGYLYVRSRAISSRCNDNFDEFPASELEKAYRSFIGKPVFVNHVNHDHKRARGVIIDAALHKDSNRDGTKDWWVEVLQEVDAVRFPRLAKEILAGNIARTSMGCDVSHSICSACGNKATTPAEYCSHIPAAKGQRLYRTTASGKKEGVLIRETCFGLKFFENSLLVEPPADPTAYFTGVDASGLDKAASKTAAAAEGLSWDEIGERHPGIYGDSEIHGEAAEHADGEMIGSAANDLAHSTPDDPDAEGHSVHDLTFHRAMIDPQTIDHKRHEAGDGRVASAIQGYKQNPEQMPPVVLVHRHGVFQVADGHHRVQAAKAVGMDKIPAYVTKSPFPRTPSGWDAKAPYHGAETTRWSPPQAPRGRKPQPTSGPGWDQPKLFEAAKKTLTGLFSEAVNQEGGELPAFPWDKAPKVNLPMTQKGWDDPRRKDMYDAKGEQDAQGPAPAGPYQGLIDKLPNYADQELSNPHGMGAADAGRSSKPRGDYPGDKREQWARSRWDNVKWPNWTDHDERPSTPTEIASSKRNIRTRWSKTWKRPLACEHDSCPPWEHEGDPTRPTGQKPGQTGVTMPNGHPLDPFEDFMPGGKHHEPEADEDGQGRMFEGHLQMEAAPKFVSGPAPTEPAPPGADETNKPGPIVHDGSKYHVVDQHGRAMQWTHNADGVSIHSGHDTYEDANTAKKKISDFRAANHWAGPDGDGDPTKHPFYRAHPVHHKHVVDAWNEATPDEHAYGMHWYAHAHEIGKAAALRHPDLEMRHAKAVVSGDPAAKARTEAEAAHKGAGVLSAYSPQVNWWDNQHHALSSFLRGSAVKSGDGAVGMASAGSQQGPAQRVMNGEHHQNVLGGEKTRKFAKLIENKGTSNDVVIDRHAIAVATGGKILPPDKKPKKGETAEEAADRKAHNIKHTFPTNSKNLYAHAEHVFHQGTDKINEDRSSKGLAPVTPSQVQAVTWLVQQRRNGTQNVVTNQHNRWREHGREHLPKQHEEGNYHLAVVDDDDYEQDGDNGAAHWRKQDPGAPDCAVCGYPLTYNVPKRRPLDAGWGHADAMKRDHPGIPSDGRDSGQEWERTTRNRENARKTVDKTMQTAYDKLTFDEMTKGLHEGSRKTAYGETKAPEDVDTLREDSCPVCGDRDTFDGATCQVCGYVTPPKLFQDPDLEMARSMDLRKDIAQFDGAPGQPVDPNALDENGNPIPGAAPQEQQPGSLPGEVQAEVQPGGDPMGQQMPGQDGQIPDEMGEPVDPSLLGPDGQPIPQGQNAVAPDGTPLPMGGQPQPMQLGPDGMPLGPQELPPGATTQDGQPFTPGPNMPLGPGQPQEPEGPMGPEGLGQDGQIPNPDAGQGVPGTPGDGVPDLTCPACGFQADATAPVSVDMDTANMPDAGVATPDGVQAGDICPNCGQGLLISPAEEQGAVPPPPVPGQQSPM
jgi:hypothetical protein